MFACNHFHVCLFKYPLSVFSNQINAFKQASGRSGVMHFSLCGIITHVNFLDTQIYCRLTGDLINHPSVVHNGDAVSRTSHQWNSLESCNEIRWQRCTICTVRKIVNTLMVGRNQALSKHNLSQIVLPGRKRTFLWRCVCA